MGVRTVSQQPRCVTLAVRHGSAGKYTITFPEGQVPPVQDYGFWSITLYASPDGFFHANELNRTSIGSHNKLKEGSDGSVTIYVQNESPGEELESNWLPAPAGKFDLMMRYYASKAEVTNLDWRPPAVIRQ